jgi:hypothetical protein
MMPFIYRLYYLRLCRYLPIYYADWCSLFDWYAI